MVRNNLGKLQDGIHEQTPHNQGPEWDWCYSKSLDGK